MVMIMMMIIIIIITTTKTIMANSNKLERKQDVPWSDSTFAWREWSQKQDRKPTKLASLFSHKSDHEHVVIKNTKIFTF